MKLKEGTTGIYLYAPQEYINMASQQNYIDFTQIERYGFVHLFIESKQDYLDKIHEALSLLDEIGVLWISYPKSDKKNKYEVNRDVLFTLTQENGIIACSSAALDEKWSARRFKSL